MMIGSKFQNIKKSRQSNRDIYLFMKEDAGGGILVHNIQPVLTVERERERERERVGYIIVSPEITYPASIIHALASLQLP